MVIPAVFGAAALCIPGSSPGSAEIIAILR